MEERCKMNTNLKICMGKRITLHKISSRFQKSNSGKLWQKNTIQKVIKMKKVW